MWIGLLVLLAAGLEVPIIARVSSGEHKSSDETIWVRYLEMYTPAAEPAEAPMADLDLELHAEPDIDAYRRLYRKVGDPWQWQARRRLGHQELQEVIDHPANDLWIVTVAGKAEGFAELDYRKPTEVEIVYFGLTMDWVGRGLGSWLMLSVLERAWSRPVSRVWLHTCELDHPGAVGFYRRCGFSIFREARGKCPDPRAKLWW